MAFEFETLQKCKVLDVRVLAAKDRGPDDPPGAQLLLQATLSADALTMLDGSLKSRLYSKAAAAKQGALDGMEGLELTTFAEHVKRFSWAYEQTGCTVVIDYGRGGESNITLNDAKVHRLSIAPRDGGSVVLQWTVDAPGLKAQTWAKLPNMKATEIELTLTAPEPADDQQQDIEDEKPARGRGKKREPAGAEA
jgi:hypothetical protein